MLPALMATAPPQGISIENLHSNEQTSGCGYGYFLGYTNKEGQPEVFAEDNIPDNDGDRVCRIRVNGELHRVTFISRSGTTKMSGKGSIGGKFTEVWGDSSLKVTFHCTITAFLFGEETDFQGLMILELGKSKRSFKVRGFLGC
ncbi:hypothetical protein [Geothrix sp.]|uniref:hypothetical protein n=1 Tax=Geothrix sp. TaxID=1962974 RepID=UPI00260CBEA7|nr:hypothetical protein [Geothrix sp.]WIL19806.1 MAG: hypothetical protein QOZ81_002339 [Geothrix sp.]